MIKRVIILSIFYWMMVMCCPNNEPHPQEYYSIQSVRGHFSAYNPGQGVYQTPPFNRNHLNILIYPDSVSKRIASNFKGLIPGAYACDDPYRPPIYENRYFIDEIITVLPINGDFPAGSRINSVLRPLSSNTFLTYEERIIDSLSLDTYEINMSYPIVEFSLDVPIAYDSAQFLINGEIDGSGAFSFLTDKVPLN